MAHSVPVKPGETVRVYFYFRDADGVYLTTLTPAPTGEIVDPAGSNTTGLALTQVAGMPYWYRDYVMSVSAGDSVVRARCTDPACASEYTKPIVISTGNTGVTSEFDGAAETQMDAIEAQVNLIGQIGVSYGAGIVDPTTIIIVKGDTMSEALGNSIVFTKSGGPDLSTASITLYIQDNGSLACTPIDADSWRLTYSAAQSGALEAGKKYAAQIKATISGSTITLLPSPTALNGFYVYVVESFA